MTMSSTTPDLLKQPRTNGREAGGRRGQRGRWSWRLTRWLVLVLGYAFVMGPYFMVVRQAFNDTSVFPAPFEGVTLRWFRALLERDEFLRGLTVSFIVALGAAVIAVLAGLFAALAITRGPKILSHSWVTALLLSPIVIPQLVVGLALLRLLATLGWVVGYPGLIFGHAIFLTPFVIRTLAAAFDGYGVDHEQVAMTLGRKPGAAFVTTTLRMLRPAIIGSGVFAFTLSFVNVPLSLYLAPSGSLPLPIALFQFMQTSLNPLVAALSVVILAVVVGGTIVLEKVLGVRLLT